MAIAARRVIVFAALAGCAGAPASVPPRDVSSQGFRTAEGPSEALARLALALAENTRLPGSRRLRVAITELTAIDGRPCSVGPQIAEELTTSLFRSGRFHVVERRHLERVLREQRMSESGLLDPESAARVRRLLGADALLTGTVLPTPTGWHVNARIVLVESAAVVSAATANLPESGSRLACGEPVGPGVIALEPPPRRLGDPVVLSAPPAQAASSPFEAPVVANAGPAIAPRTALITPADRAALARTSMTRQRRPQPLAGGVRAGFAISPEGAYASELEWGGLSVGLWGELSLTPGFGLAVFGEAAYLSQFDVNDRLGPADENGNPTDSVDEPDLHIGLVELGMRVRPLLTYLAIFADLGAGVFVVDGYGYGTGPAAVAGAAIMGGQPERANGIGLAVRYARALTSKLALVTVELAIVLDSRPSPTREP